MRLYRVFPWIRGAAAREPGGALFLPASSQGRFDNPKLYRGFYCSQSPEGAIGERFAQHLWWAPGQFRSGGRELALATFSLPDERPLADFDRVDTLVAEQVLRVTQVSTRRRTETQALAARVFGRGTYSGLSWWSVYYADWSNVMPWSLDDLAIVGDPVPLSIGHRAVIEAATLLPRPIRNETRP